MTISAFHLKSTIDFEMQTAILCKRGDFGQYEFTSKVQEFEDCHGKEVIIGYNGGENINIGTGGGYHSIHFQGLETNSEDGILSDYGAKVCHVKSYRLVGVN